MGLGRIGGFGYPGLTPWATIVARRWRYAGGHPRRMSRVMKSKTIKLGKVIAERVLTSPQLRKRVKVRIGAPRKTKALDFIAPYQILGIGDEKVRYAAGVDSVQALELGFKMIGADLHSRHKDIEFELFGEKGSGFPKP
jgi:hypothetical protein